MRLPGKSKFDCDSTELQDVRDYMPNFLPNPVLLVMTVLLFGLFVMFENMNPITTIA